MALLEAEALTGAEWEKSVLKAHNDYRALHGDTGAMVWDDAMAAKAKTWSEGMLNAGKMEHAAPAVRDNAGENLAYTMNSAGDYTKAFDETATKRWYDELTNPGFSYKEGYKYQAGAGHFSQVVWKAS